MDVASLVLHSKHQRLILDYAVVSATAVLIYDYCLTLHLEIKHIWLSPWTYTKVLFLLIRYMVFVDAFLFAYNQTFLNVSAETCNSTYPVAAWFLILQVFLSEAVLCIRTWAVWRGNKTVGIGLVALTLAQLVLQCVFAHQFIASIEFAPSPIPGFRGCFITKASSILWKNYLVMTAVEAVVLILMVISAYRSYKGGNVGELSHVIHRDGILFYIYLLGFSIANFTTTLTLPMDIMILLTPLQDTLYSVFTTRIVLNIRDVSTRGLPTELHTSHYEPLEFPTQPIPLVIMRDEHRQDCAAISQV